MSEALVCCRNTVRGPFAIPLVETAHCTSAVMSVVLRPRVRNSRVVCETNADDYSHGFPLALAEYAKLAPIAMKAAGGRFLVRGTPAKVYELGINQRTVVVEFDSLAKALEAYESPAYKDALKVLGEGSVERDMRVVEGVE